MRHIPCAMVMVCLFMPVVAVAGKGIQGNLVDAPWLEKHRADAGVLVLDASPAQAYAAKHIPGAVSADIFSYGVQEATPAAMEQRLQSWGVSPGKTIVLYDGGGTYLATRLFFTLAYYGYPIEKLAILDGGLAKWQAGGLPVSADPAAAPQGSFKIAKVNEELRVRLPEVLTASGDRAANALVEALDPEWHYGQTAPFDKEGHIPNSVLLPADDFFNADKTFKSPDELHKMAAFMNVRPEQRVYTYCGGGVAASVPFFAFKYLLGYPKVELFIESELGWLKDERELPYWTYDAPFLMRRTEWLQAWGSKMMRMYKISDISVIDIRPKESFDQGHVPFALNIPAEIFQRGLSSPDELAAALGAAGVDPAHEAVIVSGAGLTKEAALAFAFLEKLGQKKVSIFIDSLDTAAQRGLALTKDPTAVGSKKGKADVSISPAAYPVSRRTGIMIVDAQGAPGIYPKVFVASGKALPAAAPAGTVVHVPYADLLAADGTPKAAKEIWAVLTKAGVPRYAELITIADDPAEAAANYFILRLMGFADVKMLAVSGGKCPQAMKMRG